jgi:hypothetical protein
MNMIESSNIANIPLRGEMRLQVDMGKHTSWRTGGMAERMYQPADLDDLLVYLRGLPSDEPLYAVGLGSNLLVRDGGLRGTVLLLHGTLSALHLELDGSIYAEAGVPGAKLARFGALHNMQGAEFFAGIPGTLGGMLAMNAGCYGSETWEKVLRVQTVISPGKRGMVCRCLAAILKGGRRICSTGDQGLAQHAHCRTAAQFSKCRFGIPQSRRGSCRTVDRSVRLERKADRWRTGIGKTCQFHREYRHCICGGY